MTGTERGKHRLRLICCLHSIMEASPRFGKQADHGTHWVRYGGSARTDTATACGGRSSRKRRATSGRGPSRSLDTTRTRYRSTYIMVQSRILDQGRPGLTRACIATELPSSGWLGWGGFAHAGRWSLDAAYSGRVCWETGMAWRRTLPPARPGNRTTAACSSHLQTCSFRLGSLQLLGPHHEASSGLIF